MSSRARKRVDTVVSKAEAATKYCAQSSQKSNYGEWNGQITFAVAIDAPSLTKVR